MTGSPVSGPDLQGEICIKTCQMSPGYLDTKDDLLDSEGYFHTGDMGYYDKDGIIHFVEQVGWAMDNHTWISLIYRHPGHLYGKGKIARDK